MIYDETDDITDDCSALDFVVVAAAKDGGTSAAWLA